MEMNHNKDTNSFENEISRYKIDFINFIYHRFGIEMSKRSDDLYKTINKACQIFKFNPKDYLEELKKSNDHSAIVEHLINNITIGETYFFRDKNQMRALTETILPEIINCKKKQQNYNLRIWSAGVSSGEEIYTIAMILNEILEDNVNWKISLLGTDINTQQLKKAINGEYTEWSMRSIDEYYKNKYFKKNNNSFILSKKIVDMVNFSFLNLNENSYPSIFNGTNAQDIIFCRNVLIYFDATIIKNLMNKLSQCLNEGGYLILGASDPALYNETNLKLSQPTILQLTSSLKKEVPSIVQEKLFTPTVKIKAAKIDIKQTKQEPNRIVNKHAEIEALLACCEWQKVIKLITLQELLESKSLFLMRAKALALANIGQLKEAVKVCEECIALFPADKYIYFTYALVQQECHHLAAAETALRKVIYLDHAFVVAHFQLGLLHLKKHNKEIGLKSLRNALKLTKNYEQNDKVPGTTNVTYGQLAEILQNELDIYGAHNIERGDYHENKKHLSL